MRAAVGGWEDIIEDPINKFTDNAMLIHVQEGLTPEQVREEFHRLLSAVYMQGVLDTKDNNNLG